MFIFYIIYIAAVLAVIGFAVWWPIFVCNKIRNIVADWKKTIFGKAFNCLLLMLNAILIYPILWTIWYSWTSYPHDISGFCLIIANYFAFGLFRELIPLLPFCLLLGVVIAALAIIHNIALKNMVKRKFKMVEKSFEKINYDLLSKELLKFVKDNDFMYVEDIPSVKADSVMLPSTEHYEFSQKQLDDINKICREIIMNSPYADVSIGYHLLKNEDLKNNLRLGASFSEFLNSKYFSVPELIDQLENMLLEPLDISDRVIDLWKIKNSDKLYAYVDKFIAENQLIEHYSEKAKKYRNNLTTMYNEQNKQLMIAQKGYIGEKRVSEHLDLYNDMLINLENVRFDAENTTVEADNIVICDKGVFCIETKNYGRNGQTIEISRDGRWSRYNGRQRVDMANVSEQHNRHIAIMQRVVNNELKKRGIQTEYVKFEPIYVIANDNVQINNYSDELTVLRTSSVYPYINKFNPDFKLTKELQNEIVDIINMYKRDLLEYELKDYRSSFREQLQSIITDIKTRNCFADFYDEYINAIEKQATISEIEIEGEKYLYLK